VLSGLLLAAGGSQRLGRPKQLLEFEGETLVRRAARLLLGCTDEVVVVTGAHAQPVEGELRDLPVRAVRNEEWRSGMGGSIACGMRAISAASDGVLILLCDQWGVGPRDLRKLVAAWRANPRRGVSARWDGNIGSPAIFPPGMFDDLGRLHGESGAKALITARPGFGAVEIPGAMHDLDTLDDLRAMRDRQGG